jgi:ABC-type multidrug transport system permease subunit
MADAAAQLGAIVRRDALLALRAPFGFLARWISPLIAIAGFSFVSRLVDPHRALAVDGAHGGYFAYVSVNLAFMLLAASALQAVMQSVRYDQIVGTLEPIFATSIPAWLFAAGCAVWPITVSCAQVALSLAVAATFMGLDLHAIDPLSLLTFAVLSVVTMSAIGLFSAAGVIAFRQVPPSDYLIGGAATLLAGTLFPTRLFPPVVQAVSWCLPLTHMLRGLRAAVAGKSLAATAGDVVWLAIAGGILLPASLLALSYAVERARREGTLGHY